jgi:hypothetical protein
MLFFLAFYFSLSLTPNCRNWSPNYSVLVSTVMNYFKMILFYDLLLFAGISFAGTHTAKTVIPSLK